MLQVEMNDDLIEIVQNSITRYGAEVLVCPANPDLEAVAFPGNVQSAFMRDGGREIFEEAREIAQNSDYVNEKKDISMKVPETSAHLTTAGDLSAERVIHSVAVAYDPTENEIYSDPKVIAKSTKNALEKTAEEEFQSIGFPALGTGLYRVPLDEAADAMYEEFETHLSQATPISRIGMVFYGEGDYTQGEKVARQKFSSSYEIRE